MRIVLVTAIYLAKRQTLIGGLTPTSASTAAAIRAITTREPTKYYGWIPQAWRKNVQAIKKCKQFGINLRWKKKKKKKMEGKNRMSLSSLMALWRIWTYVNWIGSIQWITLIDHSHNDQH